MKTYSILIVIVIFAGFLRSHNLMFDSPYFFNPDEKNMAVAINQFKFPENLNPRFYAYGQFPLYLSYFLGVLINILRHTPNFLRVDFPDAILTLRIISAIVSTLTLILIYLYTQLLYKNIYTSLIATLLVATTPHLIQAAHFGTTESLLTFFFISLLYISTLYLSNKILKFKFLILTSLVAGLSAATKVSALLFITIPLSAIFLKFLTSKPKSLKNFFHLFLITFYLLLFTSIFLILGSPFNFLDYASFKGSMDYESSVALGTYVAFYTRQFIDTVPVVFQFAKVLPYALGLPLLLLGTAGFVSILLQAVKRNPAFILLTLAFLSFFIPSSSLFAKWTRFITPVIPLFSIFAAYSILKLNSKFKITNFKLPLLTFNFALLTLFVLPGLAFFTIYTRPDSRAQASEWIYTNIPSGSYVLSETANVVDIPLDLKTRPEHWNTEVISFNFYELDELPERETELISHLTKADYIFIPSRRIFINHLKHAGKFPKTARYYDLLFSGDLGFEKVAEFSSYPAIHLPGGLPASARQVQAGRMTPGRWTLWEFPDEQAEESFTVFDHPVVRIYKRVKEIPHDEYQMLLTDI